MGRAHIVRGMNTQFTNVEYAEIYFAYGVSVEKVWAGVEKRRRFFPSQRHPNGVVSTRAHEQLRDVGLLITST
jgi:hypothetical protein